MLETIRAYAAEELAVSGEELPTRDRHLAYFAGLGEHAAAVAPWPRSRTLPRSTGHGLAEITDLVAHLYSPVCSPARRQDNWLTYRAR